MPAAKSARRMAAEQREISVAEFFLKNRHLLGFDSPARALLTAVKEAVDNSLDACEEAGILPEVWVEVEAKSGARYRVAIEDNGPGIVEEQVARIFGKLLYGSKFHRLAQSRGQQGMGVSAAGMYAQLTTGSPLRVITRVAREASAREMLVTIDTAKNRPDIHRHEAIEWERRHGTRVELELEGLYQHGQHSIALYLKLTAIVNPHVTLHLREPDGSELHWKRQLRKRPPTPRRIKPHPAGVELGMLISMLKSSEQRRLGAFLREEFSQVGSARAREILERAGAGLNERSYTRRIARAKATALHRAIATTAVSAPPTDCVVPIGQAELRRGLAREIPARFSVAVTRPPAVYRGNPFVVEVALQYGRQDAPHVTVDEHGHLVKTGTTAQPSAEPTNESRREPARLLRFANRVPLLFQQSHCAMTRAVSSVHWKRYGLEQAGDGMPLGPLTLLLHVASVWVPFTSESKEAVAAYPEIAHELELALQQCGRKLAAHLHKERRLEGELSRQSEIRKYLPHVGGALQRLLDLDEAAEEDALQTLEALIARERSVS